MTYWIRRYSGFCVALAVAWAFFCSAGIVVGDHFVFLCADGREQTRWIVSIACCHPDCPEPPITALKRGEATVALDAYGDVIPYSDADDLDAFPFL